MLSITSTCICANIHPEEFSVILAMVMASTCALKPILSYPLNPITLAILSFPQIMFFSHSPGFFTLTHSFLQY